MADYLSEINKMLFPIHVDALTAEKSGDGYMVTASFWCNHEAQRIAVVVPNVDEDAAYKSAIPSLAVWTKQKHHENMQKTII